jgi:hypothetical protein
MKVLSFDPSGNFNEGKGTTGFSISLDGNLPHQLGDIKAAGYASKHAYWNEHELLITSTKPNVIVIESYRLFGHKAKEQTGSDLETAQLIGYLEMIAWKLNIPVVFQDPSTKLRHNDDVLVKTEIIEKRGTRYFYKGNLTNLHQRDALRHDLFFNKYNKKKVLGK